MLQMDTLPKKTILFVLLGFLVFFQSGIAFCENNEFKLNLPKIISEKGHLSLSVESSRDGFSKRLFIIPDRAEIWLDNRRLASKSIGEPGTVREKHKALFLFPSIALESGYYFITIRLYYENPITNRRQWDGKTFQVGIHPGKITRISKKIRIGL